MKRPKAYDFEESSHGAFGEYETHMSWFRYSKALNEYINYLEEKEKNNS